MTETNDIAVYYRDELVDLAYAHFEFPGHELAGGTIEGDRVEITVEGPPDQVALLFNASECMVYVGEYSSDVTDIQTMELTASTGRMARLVFRGRWA